MRGRVTVPDILKWLVAVAAVGGLYPVLADSIAANVGAIPAGPELVIWSVPPLAFVVLLATVYAKAGLGPG